MNKSQNELRKLRKDQGLCPQCGNKLDRDGAYCSRCNIANNKSKLKIKQILHEESKCTNCNAIMDRIGWFCKKCAKKYSSHAKERSAYRRLNGLCVQCGEPETVGSYCLRCRAMRMERYRANKK